MSQCLNGVVLGGPEGPCVGSLSGLAEVDVTFGGQRFPGSHCLEPTMLDSAAVLMRLGY